MIFLKSSSMSGLPRVAFVALKYGPASARLRLPLESSTSLVTPQRWGPSSTFTSRWFALLSGCKGGPIVHWAAQRRCARSTAWGSCSLRGSLRGFSLPLFMSSFGSAYPWNVSPRRGLSSPLSPTPCRLLMTRCTTVVPCGPHLAKLRLVRLVVLTTPPSTMFMTNSCVLSFASPSVAFLGPLPRLPTALVQAFCVAAVIFTALRQSMFPPPFLPWGRWCPRFVVVAVHAVVAVLLVVGALCAVAPDCRYEETEGIVYTIVCVVVVIARLQWPECKVLLSCCVADFACQSAARLLVCESPAGSPLADWLICVRGSQSAMTVR
jgi:hypothetical protein